MAGRPIHRARRERALTYDAPPPGGTIARMPLEQRLEYIWGHDLERICELVTIPWSKCETGDKLLQVRVFEVLAKRLWKVSDRVDDEARANIDRLARELEEEQAREPPAK